MPAGHLSFLSSVSERLAAAAPTHSLGVMVQVCTSLTVASASEGASYIHCLRPWLHNLTGLAHTPRDESEAVQLKLRRCLRQLLAVAIREPAVSFFVNHSTNARWLTRMPTAPRRACRQSLASNRQDRLPNPAPHRRRHPKHHLVRHRLGVGPVPRRVSDPRCAGRRDPRSRPHHRSPAQGGIPETLPQLTKLTTFLQTLIRSTLKVVPQLPLNADWPEIAALLRIDLALSFDSRLSAQLYLPDVLHACISLAATGPALIRSAVQGLLVNTVHSLGKDPAVDAAKLLAIQDTLTGPEGERLFELNPPSATDVAGGLAWDVSDSGAELVRLMAEVIDAAAPSAGLSTS